MSALHDAAGGAERPRGPSIILIGLRCSGKTTVARNLGERMGLTALDLDEVTLKKLGQSSVAEVWRSLGEAAWRGAEATALNEVLRTQEGILALGGGTAMLDSVQAALRAHRDKGDCRIIYLRAQPATLARRIEMAAGDRPPLTGSSPADEMDSVFQARDGRYREIADLTIESDTLSPGEIADVIERDLMTDS